ncbi:helix-turn-helix domain-containing protein [Lachnospiraceae bacterium 38-10]
MQMYRILLADDEGIVLNSLQFIIEKNFSGRYELETAKTGLGAIETAERFRPDIVFMDIQMPGINGIDAMREIRKFSTNVIFVVLTAYDKFDYAKEAIGLGVLDYLNKPVNQKVVADVIGRAMKEIDARRERRKNDLQIKERMETVMPIIENGFIYSILLQERFDEDIENYKSLLGITSVYGYMLAVVFGDRQQGNYMTNAVGTSVKAQMDYYSKVREILKDTFPGAIVGNVSANKIPVFMPADELKMPYNRRIETIEQSRTAVRNMNRATGIFFRIGIGGVCRLKDALHSYDGALKALYATKGSVAHMDDLPIAVEYEENYPVETEAAIFEKLQDGKTEECIAQVDKFFDWMVSQYGDDEMSIKLKVLEFVMNGESIMYRGGGHLYRFSSRKTYLQEVTEIQGYDLLKKWFMDKMRSIAGTMVRGSKDHTNDLIRQAKEYIDDHFYKDMSLDDISRELNISPYYFSKLFKEETGENFVEYVTGRRMDRAKYLLRNPDKSIKEICAEVGYSDPNYFSRIFKKYQGVSPTEYKENVGTG